MEYADGDRLVALYPYREDAVFVNDTIITRLSSLQIGRAGSFAKNMNLAVAESRSPLMSFKNVGGGIRFTVQRDDITWMSIESIGEEPLAGRVRIVMENGTPVVKEVVEGSSKIALYAPDEQPFVTIKMSTTRISAHTAIVTMRPRLFPCFPGSLPF